MLLHGYLWNALLSSGKLLWRLSWSSWATQQFLGELSPIPLLRGHSASPSELTLDPDLETGDETPQPQQQTSALSSVWGCRKKTFAVSVVASLWTETVDWRKWLESGRPSVTRTKSEIVPGPTWGVKKKKPSCWIFFWFIPTTPVMSLSLEPTFCLSNQRNSDRATCDRYVRV